MDLQTTYYILAIICMLLGLGVLIAIAVLMFYIKTKVDAIHQQAMAKINMVGNVIEHPEKAVMTAVNSLLKLVISRFNQ